jgi:hypothetical protein
MKKLLIIAHDFPPYVSVGGLRPYNWHHYLKEYNIEPIVITRQWGNHYGNDLDFVAPGSSNEVQIEHTEKGVIIRTPYKPNLSNLLLLKHGEKKFRFIRRTISAFYEYSQFLIPIGPKINLYHAANEYLKQNKVDAIIATADPFILFKYASKLSTEHAIPWIADYRDTWVQDNIRSKNWIQKIWNAFFERQYLKNVTHITTISPFIEKQLKPSIQSIPCTILMNGYDPYLIEKQNTESQGNDFLTISLAGRIYKYHPIDSFLNVCNTFYKSIEKKNFKIKFYGINNPGIIKKLISNKYPELSSVVEIVTKIPNEELAKQQSKDNVFLLFNEYYIIGTKIFNYLALRRKIILCYANDDEANRLKKSYYNFNYITNESSQVQADIINETQSGIVVNDSNHLLSVLNELYTEFEQTGQIACESKGIEKYSRKIQVENLASLINKLSSN